MARDNFGFLRPVNDSYQGWFENGTLSSPLNTGAMNVLQTFEQGNTNCTDVNSIFSASLNVEIFDSFSYSALRNLWSCVFYPNVSRDVRDHRMPEKDVPLLIDHMDTTISSAASVINLSSTCLMGYCDDF
jgi:hypothetical protein